MNAPTTTRARPRLTLVAETAAEIMSSNPVSLLADISVTEAAALLADRGFGAAPVINEAGHPVGVISRTDILVHSREQARHVPAEDRCNWDTPPREAAGFSTEVVDPTLVRDIMTPVIFTVAPDTPAERVVEEMLKLKVHQLFVVDDDNVLVGVITGLDVLRHCRPLPP
jgi:CBS domain-containing protein